jgi:hypothetical protein
MGPGNSLGTIRPTIWPSSMYLIIKYLLKDIQKVLNSIFEPDVIVFAFIDCQGPILVVQKNRNGKFGRVL